MNDVVDCDDRFAGYDRRKNVVGRVVEVQTQPEEPPGQGDLLPSRIRWRALDYDSEVSWQLLESLFVLQIPTNSTYWFSWSSSPRACTRFRM